MTLTIQEYEDIIFELITKAKDIVTTEITREKELTKKLSELKQGKKIRL